MRKNQGTAILALIFIIVLIVIGYYVIDYLRTSGSSGRNFPNTEEEKYKQNNIDEFVGYIEKNPDTKKVKLSAKAGNWQGISYTLRSDGEIIHIIKADLPEPVSGSFYEGWLYDKDNYLNYTSTGILEEIEDGSYALIFGTDEELTGFDRIVVTSEKEDDENPEETVLEGILN